MGSISRHLSELFGRNVNYGDAVVDIETDSIPWDRDQPLIAVHDDEVIDVAVLIQDDVVDRSNGGIALEVDLGAEDLLGAEVRLTVGGWLVLRPDCG